jgi:hypothetical protein
MSEPLVSQQLARPLRVMVFVDYWNFQLTLNEREAWSRGVSSDRFKVNWLELGPWLAEKACTLPGLGEPHSFEGIVLYASYDPAKEEGRNFIVGQPSGSTGRPAFVLNAGSGGPKHLPDVRPATPKSPTVLTASEEFRALSRKGSIP